MLDSEDSAVTYTSVYTDSEPKRVFWGTDEEAYDPDFVPKPVYHEYIPLEDEHVLPAEEQPLPPVDSPTTESSGYVAESDSEEDDEEQDSPVDYPMGEGDDGGDDDSDSSRDDTADEDEDIEEEEEDGEEEEEEEEEHIASADFTVVIPVVELVSSPEGTKLVLPPPSIDITITGARISVRLQASVSLPSTEINDVGYGIRDTWIDPAEAVPAIAPTTVKEVNTKETVWTVEEEAYAARVAWNHSIGLSQATYQELQTHRDHIERQPGPDARFPDLQEVTGDMKSHP
nr:hypothetical protein [Tanacetum cinerariifolium]